MLRVGTRVEINTRHNSKHPDQNDLKKVSQVDLDGKQNPGPPHPGPAAQAVAPPRSSNTYGF